MVMETSFYLQEILEFKRPVDITLVYREGML
jgi:hypothetical protein